MTFADNHRASAFYEAKGFVPTDKAKPYHGAMEICYGKEDKPVPEDSHGIEAAFEKIKEKIASVVGGNGHFGR